MALLDDLPADMPLLLLATAELPPADPAVAAAAGPAGAGSSNSRRLLLGPSPAAAAAAAAAGVGGGASSAASQQRQQGVDSLEELGLDPTLAALFPPLGRVSDIKTLLLQASTQQQQQRQQQQQQGQPEAGPAQQQQQEQQQQPRVEEPGQGDEEQDAGGCDVLGWVVLDTPGPQQRRRMFEVRVAWLQDRLLGLLWLLLYRAARSIEMTVCMRQSLLTRNTMLLLVCVHAWGYPMSAAGCV